MLIQPTALRDFVTELFTRAGATGVVAGEVAEHLVEANLKGHDSHGVGMIPAYVRNIKGGHLDVQAHASVIRDSGAVVLVDGHHGFGQVVGREATDIAIARVKDTGVVCLGLRNAHHLGRLAATVNAAVAQAWCQCISSTWWDMSRGFPRGADANGA